MLVIVTNHSVRMRAVGSGVGWEFDAGGYVPASECRRGEAFVSKSHSPFALPTT